MAGKSDESIFDMFSAFARDLKLPKMETDAIVDQHRKNLEAVQKSISASASGAKAVMDRQRDLLKSQFDEFSEAARNFSLPGNPQEAISRQSELMRRMFETTVSNVSESAQTLQKSGAESVEILRSRIQESMDEFQDSFRGRK